MKPVYCPVCKEMVLDTDPIEVVENKVYHAWCMKTEPKEE